jgi:hypothetical protein
MVGAKASPVDFCAVTLDEGGEYNDKLRALERSVVKTRANGLVFDAPYMEERV